MHLKKILKTATLRHSFISFIGTAVTGVLGLIFYSYVARMLQPSDYGIFTLSVTTLALIASIANLGTDTGVIRFVSEYAQKNAQKASQFLKLALEIKLSIWLVLLVFGWVTMPSLVSTFFGKPELISPFRIALFGVGGMLLSSFSLAALQAYSKYTWWSVANIASNIIRLLGVVALGTSGLLVATNALWVYGGVLFVLFLFCLFLLPKFYKVQNELGLRSDFLHFNKWIAAFTAVAAIGSRIDTYLLARYLVLTQVGIYSVGVNLVSIVTQVVLALGSVVAPKLAGMETKKSAVSYLKKLQLFAVVLAVFGCVVGVPLGYILIPLVFGTAYSTAFVPFSILLIAQGVFLISVPVHMAVMYYFSYPKIFLYTTVLRLLLGICLGLILIPVWGEVGAAVTVLIGTILDFIIPAIWVLRRFKQV